MSDALLKSNIMIHELSLITASGTSYSVKGVKLSASVGASPSCIVTVVQGLNLLTGEDASQDVIPTGTRVRLSMRYEEFDETGESGGAKTVILMGGIILGTAKEFSVYASGLNAVRTYKICSLSDQADSMSPGGLYLALELSGSELKATGSSLGVVKGALRKALSIEYGQTQPAEMNLAEATAKMLDYVGTDKRTVAAKIKMMDVLDTTTCPPMRLKFNRPWPLLDQIEPKLMDSLKTQTFLNTFAGLMQSLYLTLVPNFDIADDGSGSYYPGEKLKIVPTLAWYKKAKTHFPLSEIISLGSVVSDKGYNEVDTVAVKYLESASGINMTGKESLGGTAIYAEAADSTGKRRVIKDIEGLRKIGAAGKIKMIPLPYFVSYGMNNLTTTVDTTRTTEADKLANKTGGTVTTEVLREKGWARTWAEIIAQTAFATLNRANFSQSVRIPLSVLLKKRKYLGEVVSVANPEISSAGGMLQETDEDSDTTFGLFQSWQLSIELSDTTLNVSASIGMVSVRSAEDNNEIGLDSNPMYKNEG